MDKETIRGAVAEAMPSHEDILAAITEGVRVAFDQVYGSQILDAITDGTKEALEGGRIREPFE